MTVSQKDSVQDGRNRIQKGEAKCSYVTFNVMWPSPHLAATLTKRALPGISPIRIISSLEDHDR